MSLLALNEARKLWHGAKKLTKNLVYGVIRVKIYGIYKATTVHRPFYVMVLTLYPLTDQRYVSHLCHNSLCINTGTKLLPRVPTSLKGGV